MSRVEEPEDSLQALLRAYRAPPEVREERLWQRVRAERRQETVAGRPALSRWLRPAAAAASVLLVALPLLSSPGRAWMVDRALGPAWTWAEARLGSLAGGLRPERARRGAPPPRPQRVTAAIPADGALLVHVLHCQPEGMLTVQVRDRADVSLEEVHPSGTVRLTAAPGELRVRNHPGSTGSYRLGVPPHAGFVWVRLGQASPVRLPETVRSGGTLLLYLQEMAHSREGHCTES